MTLSLYVIIAMESEYGLLQMHPSWVPDAATSQQHSSPPTLEDI